MLGLNIHLKSFDLKSSLISENDKVRVSITTFPEQNKEAFITEAKQMNHVHHFFTVNISKETQKIVLFSEKLDFLTIQLLLPQQSTLTISQQMIRKYVK